MAENRESVILQVGLDAGKVAQDLNALVTRIAALKKQQEDLNKQIKAGNDIDGAYAEQLIRVKDQLAWTEKQAKGLSATTKLLNADTMTYSDSLNGERQKLADMQKAYDELDADMRNSEGGKKLLEAIKSQSDAVKGLEEDTGRFGRNVGNYQSALEGMADKAHLLGDSFKATAAGSTLLGKGVDSVDKTMKVMTKNPLMGIVVALAPILSKIIGLVSQNESLMKALNKVLKPLGDALGWVADLISNVLVGALDALSSAWDAAVGFFSDAADWLGITSSSTEETKVETDKYAESIENLTKQLGKQQKALEKSQKLHKYVIDYMRAAGAEQDAIAEQTLKYAQDEMHQRQKIYADAQKRVDEYIAKMREEGKTYTENGQEMIRAGESIIEEFRKIKAERDQAQNDMIESEREVAIQLKQMETDRTNAEKEAAEERAKERAKQQEELAKQREQMRVRNLTGFEKDLDDLRKAEEKELETIGLSEAEKEQIRAYYQQKRIDRIQQNIDELAAATLAEEKRLGEESKALLEEWEEYYEETIEEQVPTPEEMARNLFGLDEEGVTYFKELLEQGYSVMEAKGAALSDQTGRMAKNWQTALGGLNDVFKATGDAITELAGESEEGKKVAKAFAWVSLLTSQAQAIANTVQAITQAIANAQQSAAATGPAAAFTAPAFIAEMVAITSGAAASAIAGIVSAKQLLSQADGYEYGGVVGGNSYTGDKILIRANSGEGITTGKQANNLLQEIANNPARGGLDYERMTDAFASAVAALPAPVMVYQEYKDFEQNVSTFNEIASI